ncbi:hypothetical protein GUITHDRAFT_120075 [Guillardia theta CCMP2712]|uniref:Uncharacterized protein n=1 Tax=Guillardia theta (strain CCMP2712) TaxID=905079 RepID=L1ID33_GUITC|nr:hypothetical protein GUITHDRAFT_120075 [Guillardia theta CCMP2712]EKX33745.1 hypothetical protein GUITHDRAFT_120075 [Guillardia theta CCMP2712]|eukprot:XP_005820725.1 hypothetical protein GUITHDRAFT_120075 [Guillardia theta CCMP2712]
MYPPLFDIPPSFLLDDASLNPFLLLPIDPVDIQDDPSGSATPDALLPSITLSSPDDPSLDVLPPLPDDTAPADACRGLETSRWDAAARSKHSSACRGRSRLTAQEKLDIVCLYYSAPVSPTGKRSMQQQDLSRRYGKSRAAISKVLRPEYARGVMTAGQGLKASRRAMVLRNIAEEERGRLLALGRSGEGVA